MSDDDNLFQSEMGDVEPLRREPRAVRSRTARRTVDRSSAEALAHRRQAAEEGPEADRNTLSDRDIEPLDAWYVLSFKRPGVQHGVFRKLKQGRYEAQARLDLHRMSVQRARRETFQFIEDSMHYGLRSVMVVHGKGSGGREQQTSLLKGCVDRWLRELDAVQAFHSAQPRHGGTGAAYILLRKSEEQKRQTREQFTRGGQPPE